MEATDDVFGQNPNRPAHPDFWRLSEIVLANDGRVEEAFDQEKAWKDTVADVVDVESIVYMASQRVMLMMGPPQPGNVTDHATLTALYIDAFLTGALFERRGGKQ